jgi:hypothetical protein
VSRQKPPRAYSGEATHTRMRPIQYGEDGMMITDAMSQTYHSQIYNKTPKMPAKNRRFTL